MRRKKTIGAMIIVLIAAITLGTVVWIQVARSPRTQIYALPRVDSFAVPTDQAAIARGKYLTRAVAVCHLCHGEQLGGKLAFDDVLLGKGYTPNLTRGEGGIANTYQTQDWARAIKHGLNPQGRGLLFMPSDHYRYLRDDDLAALVAYIQNLPPVDNTRSQLELSRFAKLMIDVGLSGPVVRAAVINDQSQTQPIASDADYLIAIAGCSFCHGQSLQGGQGLEPGAPPGPSLINLQARDWRYDQFVTLMREGKLPSGKIIDPRFMPWQGYANMTDQDLKLIWQRTNQPGSSDSAH